MDVLPRLTFLLVLVRCGQSAILRYDREKGSGSSNFSFSSYYSNHMVLQRAPYRAVIWGYDSSSNVGKSVTLMVSLISSFSGLTTYIYKTTVVKDPSSGLAVWTVSLDPMLEPGPCTIEAIDANYVTINITDVLFGDVWVCSGQSNMQFTVDMGLNASAELEDAYNYLHIRVFTVQKEKSTTPEMDLLSVLEQWSVPSKDTVGHAPWTYFSAVCWLFGKYLYSQRKYPIGLVSTTWGGTPIEAWSSPAALAKCGLQNSGKYTITEKGLLSNSELWNAMVHPLLNMTIYGVIWYQGENNAAQPETYSCRFPAMIDDWRLNFFHGSFGATNPIFPFGFVQLAGYRNDSSITKGFPDIRWAQTAGYGYVPNQRMQSVFMSVAMDLPDFESPYGSIHPRDKQDVAARLHLAGLAVAYNISGLNYQGPFPTSVQHNPSSNTVWIEYGDKNPVTVLQPNGFELCCSAVKSSLCNMTDEWFSTPITTHNASLVVLTTSACQGKQINGVRYAWRESPCEFKNCAVYGLYNKLPAPPYLNLHLNENRKSSVS